MFRPDRAANPCPGAFPVHMVEDAYFRATHYNLKYKTGAVLNRITAHDISGMRPQDIEWIWIVEEKRNATPEEIRELCKRAPKG